MSRILLLLYIATVLYIWLHAISELLFHHTTPLVKLNVFLAKIMGAVFWPIVVFSEDGRKALFNYFERNNF